MQSATFKILLGLLALALPVSEAVARRGYVRTREGRVLEGHLRFESNSVVIVDAAKELWAEVRLTNLLALGFESQAEIPDEISPDAPAVMPAPWIGEDVGSARETGEAGFVRGTFRVRATGTNALGDGDSFHFIHKRVGDESELIARVLRVQARDPWARAGLMVRGGLEADAPNVFLAVTAGRGGQLTARERKGGTSLVALDRGMAGGSWVKLKRNGDVITALRSPDGRRWRTVEKMTVALGAEVFAGLAVVGCRSGDWSEATIGGVEEGVSLRNRAYVPQVELTSGSLQAGYIDVMDDTAVRFDAREHRAPVSTHGVAVVRFQPVPAKLGSLIAAGRKGALLTSGEFIEGEFGGIANHRVTINSVPLGLKRYDVNSEVIALTLGRRAVMPRRVFEVKTTDGATWLALDVTLDQDGLLLREPLLGMRRIALHEIAELRRTAS